MAASPPTAATAAQPTLPGLTRTLSVWQAVGVSVGLMAPSMAANINPQASEQTVGRAVPLAFLLAAVGVLLVCYVFVRLCQYFRHAGSVYAFVGATLGARTGVIAGWGLLGTYTFYGVTTSSVVGLFGTNFLKSVGIWPNPPGWAPFTFTAVVLVLTWLLTVMPARRGTNTLLTVEGLTIALILIVSVVVLVRLVSGNTPAGQHFTLNVFTVPAGTSTSAVFLGVVFGFLSFAGFEAASTLGEEAANPNRDIPRAMLGTAIFGGVFFVVVTAVEMMGFGTNSAGTSAFGSSSSLLGDLGSQYVAPWIGDAITLGATVSAFGCCLACVVGGARLLFGLSRDAFGDKGVGKASRFGTPGNAGLAVAGVMAVIIAGSIILFHATAEDTFTWGGTIGTLILLVVYILATLGCIGLVFVRRKLPVARWQVVIPLAALVVLGYTLYRNVVPYPTGAARWFPVASGGWLLLAILAVVCAPGVARRLGRNLAESEGIRLEK